jgi:hypothetical protein
MELWIARRSLRRQQQYNELRWIHRAIPQDKHTDGFTGATTGVHGGVSGTIKSSAEEATIELLNGGLSGMNERWSHREQNKQQQLNRPHGGVSGGTTTMSTRSVSPVQQYETTGVSTRESERTNRARGEIRSYYDEEMTTAIEPVVNAYISNGARLLLRHDTERRESLCALTTRDPKVRLLPAPPQEWIFFF